MPVRLVDVHRRNEEDRGNLVRYLMACQVLVAGGGVLAQPMLWAGDMLYEHHVARAGALGDQGTKTPEEQPAPEA